MPSFPLISCSYLPLVVSLLLTRFVHWITGSVSLIGGRCERGMQQVTRDTCLCQSSDQRTCICDQTSSSSMDPMHLPLTVDTGSLHEDAVVVARHVRPEWKDCKVNVRDFTDGITNRLVGCFLSDAPNDIVLVRVYGEKTERFIDRKIEKWNMMMMSSRRLAPPLFASFNNGLCYGFTPGTPIDGRMVRDPVISRLIAQKLARMHFIKFADSGKCDSCQTSSQRDDPSPCLLTALDRYLNYVPDVLTPTSSFPVPQKRELLQEVAFIKFLVADMESPVVFCHNDLLLKNIIYHKDPVLGPGVTFIDFEYAAYNFQAFDIANHFCEFAGIEVYDPSLFPDLDFQKTWLKHYLQAWKELNNCHQSHMAGSKKCDADLTVSPDEVEVLLKQVEKLTLASHLWWSIWGLIQSQHSTIHFDFQRYTYQRMQQYYVDKGKIRLDSRNGH